MRSDMFKVIVERPRLGRQRARSPKLRLDHDPDRHSVGLKRHVAEQFSETKMLNENLSPLRRYLFKQRGRPWSKVYSEICAQLDPSSTVKMHVRDHISDYVMIRVTITPGGNWLGTSSGRFSHANLTSWPDLYVDPKDGRLKETKRLLKTLRITPYRRSDWVRRKKARDNPPDMLWITPIVLLHKTDGLWMRYGFDVPPELHPDQLRIALVSGTVSAGSGKPVPVTWRVTAKQQLSKQMLRQHGLINDAAVPDHIAVPVKGASPQAAWPAQK